MKYYVCVVSALALVLTACGPDRDKKTAGPPAYMLYSPNGEPLNGGPLGKPGCGQAISGWFGRLSAGGNGRISRAAFLSDTLTQFARMDIDHNGYIVSEELDRFREPYRQQPAAPKPDKKDAGSAEGLNGHGHKGKGGHGGAGGDNQSDLSFTTADPVMSADANLDFKVTPEEFLQQAQEVFAGLDGNHDGFLDRAEIMTLCRQKP